MAQPWDRAVGVVTPEAVRLQFSEANVGSRGVALVIDAFIMSTILSLLNATIGLLLLAPGDALPGWVVLTVLLVLNFLVVLGYPVVFETMMRGSTPGKAAMGLRVVTVEGAPVSFRHAAIRAALAFVDFLITLGLGAILATLLSKRHQRLGDMVAGTVVLRERTAEATPWASQFLVPRGAESYAVTIDPSGLSAGDYDLVRSFLLRAQKLAPQPRREIGERLAELYTRKLHHDRPTSVSAELFLSCLAARYQERHFRPEQPDQQAPPESGAITASPSDTVPPASPPPAETWGDFTPPS